MKLTLMQRIITEILYAIRIGWAIKYLNRKTKLTDEWIKEQYYNE